MLLTSLSDNVSLTLPDDLLWIDEHSWTPPVATVSYLLTGALLVESAVRQAGRPITLIGNDDMGWVTQNSLDKLYYWTTEPHRKFKLLFLDGRAFNIAYRHNEPSIESKPILGFPTRSDSDFHQITLRFLTI